MTEAVYCQNETPEFVARMDGWLTQIADLFHHKLGANYVASILMGGYGRGWGAMLPSSVGPMPINDLDIAVVTKDRLTSSQLLELHKLCTQIVNPESRYDMLNWSDMDVHADVMNFVAADFQHLQPSQFHMDLVYGSRVFDGQNVLLDAVAISPQSLDPGDALRLLFNHAINLFEPCAIGDPASLAARTALFFTATKAATAAGSAVIMLHGRYSSAMPQRFEALQHLTHSRAIADLISDCPVFVANFEQFSRDRGLGSQERIDQACQYYMQAQDMILASSRHCMALTFDRQPVNDARSLAEAIHTLWKTEYIKLKEDGMNPKSLAKKALQFIGIRPKPSPWGPRATVYAAGVCLLSAFTISAEGDYSVDPEQLELAANYLQIAGVEIESSPTIFDKWQTCGRAAVSALKNQNWIR